MATLKDIADRAGVSIGTVDRIIHDRGRYSKETAEKVRRILEETDYRPNVMARHLSKSGTCRLAALIPESGQDSGYWAVPLNGMRLAEKELEPFGLSLEVIFFDRFRKNGLIDAGGTLIGRNDIDGLLMAPMRPDEAEDLLERLHSKIPVVCFDTDLPGTKRMSYIGQDSYKSGHLGARLTMMSARSARSENGANSIHSIRSARSENGANSIHSACSARSENGTNSIHSAIGDPRGPSGKQERSGKSVKPDEPTTVPTPPAKYLVVAPMDDNVHLEKRRRGFIDGVNNIGGSSEVLRITVESDGDTANFYKLLDEHITSETAGIFVVNASTHFIAEYLNERNLCIALVGYDLVPENKKWLEKGLIDFLLTQRPVQQGYRAVRYLFRKIVMGEDCPDHEYTPIDIVARENLEYLDEENQ